jgi:hypothetical protein
MPISSYVGRLAITRHEEAIIIVVIMTVGLRPILSPIYPKRRALNGLKRYILQNVVAATREEMKGSNFGKNKSFNNTAMCTYNIRSKYSRKVPICSNPTASFCSLLNAERIPCLVVFIMLIPNIYSLLYLDIMKLRGRGNKNLLK